MDRDIEVDLRVPQAWPQVISRAGGYPLLVLPLGVDNQVVAEGRACQDQSELARTLVWAMGLSPRHQVRLVPVELRKPEVEFG
jgi:hypothetical protein